MRKVLGISIWLLPIMLAMLSCSHAPQTYEPPNTALAASAPLEVLTPQTAAPPPQDIVNEEESGDEDIEEEVPVPENQIPTEQSQKALEKPEDTLARPSETTSAPTTPTEDTAIAMPPAPIEKPSVPASKDRSRSARVYDLPYKSDPRVDEFIKRSLTKDRAYFEYCLERFDKVRPTMERIFKEHGLPKDLVYLAMVESGGNPNAVSPAGAVGYWQFLPGTARLYGLKVDRWVDERRDLEKSTHAAADYLNHLYGLFDDWLLACAAYNAGEGAIMRLLDRHKHVDSFWDISRPMLYKDETLAFVPKILSNIKICKNREKYGVKYYDEGTPPHDVIKVDALTSLEHVADASGCAVTTLAGLNPELVRKCTPPYARAYEIKIPRGKGDTVASALSQDDKDDNVHYTSYVVQKGDTLFAIARRHHTTPAKIAAFNKISRQGNLALGKELMIPEDIYLKAIEKPSYAVAKVDRDASVASIADESDNLDPKTTLSEAKLKKTRVAKASSKSRTYRVRKGDTIWSISRQFDVNPKDVMRWNRTLGQIKPGEKLKIYAQRS